MTSPPTPPNAREVWRRRAVPALLLCLFACAAASSLLNKSPTYDEAAHLPAGYYYLKTGRFDLYSNNPPLSKLIGAAPLLTMRPALPERLDDNHWLYGYRFQLENAPRYHSVFIAGRLTMLLVGLLLGTLIYKWSLELFGRTAALGALTFFAFSPNLLANATLVTPDIVLTTSFFATAWALHRACLDPSPARFALTGLALGLALLSKFTAVLLLPLLIALGWFVPRSRRLGGLAIACGTALLVVNAGYLFRDVFYPFDGIVFQSQLFRSLPAWLRLPIPADWLQGFDVQLADNAKVVPSYLLGRTYTDGAPWYYELIAIGVKTTIPLLLLSVAGAAWLARGARREALFLLLPVAFLLSVFAAVVKLELGLRYVLPIYPFLMVAAGYAVARLWEQRAALRAAVPLLLGWHVVTSAAAYPDYLSYFNEGVGGGRNGSRFLVDSNLDWGQDLPALERFMAAEGIQEIGLSYFGLVDPGVYGIQYHLIPVGPLPEGWYAVSATHLVGLYDPDQNPVQTLFRGDADLSQFRERDPVEVLGNSIFVYRVGADG